MLCVVDGQESIRWGEEGAAVEEVSCVSQEERRGLSKA